MKFLIFSVGFLLLTVVTQAASIQNLVIVGDSLTEGYGVAREKAYPALLEEKLAKKHAGLKITNSGIGGSTSASAPSRAKWVLKSNPDLVVFFLGGNDALRGIEPAVMKKNLKEAIKIVKEKKVKVLLVEMLAPPNYGKDYTQKFKNVFSEIKSEEKIDLLKFPLENVAGQKDLNQKDGIHPNEMGHEKIAEDLAKALEKYL